MVEETVRTARPWQSHVVVAVDLPERPSRRLAELGVRVGAHVSVHQRTAGGGRVVVVDGSHIALDGRTASCIRLAGA